MNKLVIKHTKGERIIGKGQRVFIVAEMSGNHNGDIQRAYQIIDAAAAAGADAVKLQTYTSDTITIDSDREYFQVKESKLWGGQTLYKLYGQAYTPWEWQQELKAYAESKNLIFFSTPFDDTAVDFLEKLQVPLYKVSSFEVVDTPLLARIGQTNRPVIMSRGMASAEELEEALRVLKETGCPAVALLHCISAYPAKSEEMNLLTIPDMAERFEVVTGLSDHSLGPEAAIASVALGASIIEKHLTLARADGGPDAAFSLEPEEFQVLVSAVRATEQALGQPNYGVTAGERENVKFRKSLFAVADIKAGETFTRQNVRSIRPGQGLKPKFLNEILGKQARKGMARGTPLSWELIKK